MLELYHGRPESVEGRLPREVRTYDLLDSLGIDYYRLDHDPASTMKVCEEIELSLGALICKNLFLCNRQKTQFYLLMIAGEKKFKTKDLSHQIGSSRLSFAGAEDMEACLDISPGAVSIMGLMNDKENRVRLLVDEEVLRHEDLGCHPCVNTSSLRLKTADAFGPVLKAMHHDYTVVVLENVEEE